MSESVDKELHGQPAGVVSIEPEAAEAVAPPVEPPGLAAAPPARRPVLSAAWDLLHDVSITVLFCFFIVTFVAQPVRVQGASMQPRIEDNERILINKAIYRFQGVERGDVVVFYYPRDPSVSYIKRVIGLPGDRVEIRNGTVYVNEAAIEEPYLLPEYRDRYDMPETLVERGHYFVMGDHRTSSMDSRSFGSVPEKYIYGKATFCVWPIEKTGRVR
ncbi:MAG TPA: signal peptidase I [Vicinamibacteria bacterium]|nr:signal peptidase I [Vicinamibacteria bacterium]HRB12120.1 signal peptidase I [Vicinamibacteria bacterium]